MTSPLVSIITPTYNHQKYLGACIGSVLAQSYPQWELLIMDDESTDRTPEIARSFADDRIRYHRQPHRGIHGLADTYNDALQRAQGDLIAILEGDDFWPSNKLQTLVPQFERPDIVLAYGLARIVRSDGTQMGETVPSRRALRTLSPAELHNGPIGSAVRPMLLPDPGMFTYPCTLLIRRRSLEALGGFLTVADRHAVDWATCLSLALAGSFAFVPQIMGFWRRHTASVNSSLQLENHVREDYRYVRAFAESHRQMLGLSEQELHGIDRAWDRFWSSLWRMQGRHFLLQRDWRAARGRFLRTLTRPDTGRGRLGSVLGILASLLHTNIECVWRLRGRLSLDDAA